MLASTKKPYNPNKNFHGITNTNNLTAAALEWDKSDLCDILHNLQTISQKDLAITGNQYTVTSSKNEIIAELIATMNCGHYNVLCGMRDIIKQNNCLIKKTQISNKSVDQCVKKMNELEIKLKGVHLLLTQTLNILPDIPLTDFQSIIRAKNIIDDVSLNVYDSSKPRTDINIIQPTHPTINGSPEQTIELETTQSFCATEISCKNNRGQINLFNEPHSNHNLTNKTTTTTTTDTIVESHINPLCQTQSKDSIIDEQNDQIFNVSINPSAILRTQTYLLNEPQPNHITINTITTSSITDKIDAVHINTLDETQNKITSTKSCEFTHHARLCKLFRT